MRKLRIVEIKKTRMACYHSRFFGAERGIRTPGNSRFNGFQDRRNRPLYHLCSYLTFIIIYERKEIVNNLLDLFLTFFSKKRTNLKFVRFFISKSVVNYSAVVSAVSSVLLRLGRINKKSTSNATAYNASVKYKTF